MTLFFCQALMAQEDASLWQIETSDTQSDYYGATVANGGIGILPLREPFKVKDVILNHVFDVDDLGISTVLKGINPFGMMLKVEGRPVEMKNISGWKQTLNLREARLITEFTVSDKVRVEYSVCALRNMAYAGLVSVKVKALKDTDIEAINHTEIPEDYIDRSHKFHFLNADGQNCYIYHAYANSPVRKHRIEAASTFILEKGKEKEQEYVAQTRELCVPFDLKAGEEVRFALVGSVCTSRDFVDPYNETEREVIYAQHEGFDKLLESHCKAWNELWRGDIEIEGDDDAQRAVRLALYNLYSSCREGSDLSIAPMGLSSQGYKGHIFWDSELWMFPPMLMLNQGIAQSMMNYRTDRVAAAHKKALAFGYRGAMFPWESDDSGSESTPTMALCGVLEQHITADVGIACWNYYCMSGDRRWLEKKGYPLMKEVADFWVSRAEKNLDGSYSINSVVGANEYKAGANDNAFTNGSAKTALFDAIKAAEVLDEEPGDKWEEVAEGLRILKFPDGVTREHSTYNGEKIKQADVNLLGYPLCLIRDNETLKKDLEYYSTKIDTENGPAMGFSVFAVQYARLGDADKAYEMFCRSYQPNQRPPFGALSETAARDDLTFMTGAGGMLQAVINGFCGLQITDEGIQQLPAALPKHWKKVTLKGVGPMRKEYVNRQNNLTLSTTDHSLKEIFDWAVRMSNNNVGNSDDPVGPWYCSALPGRSAFCMRDVSHQCIGEEINHHGVENKNIMTRFAENITPEKDYCTYWEINRWNKPAPADYVSDEDFWYNLPANLDVLRACYRLYLWTGDEGYLIDPRFTNFYELSMNQYIDRWELAPEKIMDRPYRMNFKGDMEASSFGHSRGLASYEEQVPGIAVGADLLCALNAAMDAYSKMWKIRGDEKKAKLYAEKAQAYKALLNGKWWNDSTKNLYAYRLENGEMSEGGCNSIAVWFGTTEGKDRINALLDTMSGTETNIENRTYYASVFYRYGRPNEGYKMFANLYNDPRKEYPEAASSIIESVICGMCGVEPNAPERSIATLPSLTDKTPEVRVSHIPVMGGEISLSHKGNLETTLENHTGSTIIWKAQFHGTNSKIGGRKATVTVDQMGEPLSYIEVKLENGSRLTLKAE